MIVWFSLGITIDHAVAMSLPVLSGYLWEAWGYRWVFILAGAIALGGFFVCLCPSALSI